MKKNIPVKSKNEKNVENSWSKLGSVALKVYLNTTLGFSINIRSKTSKAFSILV